MQRSRVAITYGSAR